MPSLIVETSPKSPISESYRTLRTNISFSSMDKEPKTILITSAGPKEGKTITAGNLALSIAQTGKKVLLIDCDLRNPTIHKIFNISNEKGLTDMLKENSRVQDIVFESMSNFDILPSGTIPINPSEILSSEKMGLFLEEMHDIYDNIIIDTPPLINVTDAQILAAIVDGVVLVIGSKEVPIKICKKAKSLLDNVNAKLLGAVLNKVDNSLGKYARYNYTDESNARKNRRKRVKKKKTINTSI